MKITREDNPCIFLIHIIRFLFLFLLFVLLTQSYALDSTKVYWVFFKDKGVISYREWKDTEKRISNHAKIRRKGKIDSTDLPVCKQYIDSLAFYGLRIKNISKWLNAVTVFGTDSLIKKIDSKTFINKIMSQKKLIYKKPPLISKSKKVEKIPSTKYGNLYGPLNMINVPFMHDYVLKKNNEQPGKNITIAVFDAGFDVTHPCFKHLLDSNSIISDSDFVDSDGFVGYEPGMTGDDADHGTAVLSILAGFLPDTLTGVSYASEFILARTEDDLTETSLEEDNWVAAMEWAEELGADIISSSLGYRYDFTQDSGYTPDQMDGKTAIVSIGAAIGISKGLIIVNAIGNEGDRFGANSVNAPADVDGVISVGAVNSSGNIAYFSSLGPTADNRIKPDVVAPGVNIFYAVSNSQYDIGSGTSFSTPFTSGCVALLKQLHPLWGPFEMLNHLHDGAERKLGQTNNTYGWGLVNVMASQLDSNTIFGGVFDSSSGNPLVNTIVYVDNPQDTCYTTSSGLYMFEFLNNGEGNIYIEKTGWENKSDTFNLPLYPPLRSDFILKSAIDTNLIWLTVKTFSGMPLDSAVVYYIGPTEGYLATDYLGELVIPDVKRGEYTVRITKKGYRTIIKTINAPMDSIAAFSMQEIVYGNISIYPIPCKNGNLIAEFIADSLYTVDNIRNLLINLYTLDGHRVETLSKENIGQGEAVQVNIDTSKLKSGIYYLYIKFGDRVKRYKVPIINR